MLVEFCRVHPVVVAVWMMPPGAIDAHWYMNIEDEALEAVEVEVHQQSTRALPIVKFVGNAKFH